MLIIHSNSCSILHVLKFHNGCTWNKKFWECMVKWKGTNLGLELLVAARSSSNLIAVWKNTFRNKLTPNLFVFFFFLQGRKLFSWKELGVCCKSGKPHSLIQTEHILLQILSKLGTYSLKQWAADTSQVLLISVAPQRWTLLYCKLACHGQSPVSAEDNPPTILKDVAFAIDLTDLFCRNPQTVRKEKNMY